MAAESLTLLEHGVDEFLRSGGKAAPWSRFFDSAQLLAVSGVIYRELAQTQNVAYVRYAIPALTRAANRSGVDRSRRRSLVLLELATSHLIDGRADRAAAAGADAIEAARRVTSARVLDRLRLLRLAADQWPREAGANELSERITGFIGAGPGPAADWARGVTGRVPVRPA
jgi:hypothetical protein